MNILDVRQTDRQTYKQWKQDVHMKSARHYLNVFVLQVMQLLLLFMFYHLVRLKRK